MTNPLLLSPSFSLFPFSLTQTPSSLAKLMGSIAGPNLRGLLLLSLGWEREWVTAFKRGWGWGSWSVVQCGGVQRHSEAVWDLVLCYHVLLLLKELHGGEAYIFWKIIKLGKKEMEKCILRIIWENFEKSVLIYKESGYNICFDFFVQNSNLPNHWIID